MSARRDVSDMVARYQRRQVRLRRILRPPDLFVYNPRESFLPSTPSPRLLIGGAGGTVPEGFLCVDLVNWPGVRVVADVQTLPFLDGTVQAIECDAVLEHVVDPHLAVAEFERVLAPGGFLHVVVPFNHPFHAYPGDYRRWTLDGLTALLSRFQVVHRGVRTGPSATLLLYLVEYLCLLAPTRLRGAVYYAVGWLAWPLRYVDVWLFRSPDAHILANSIFALARKSVAGHNVETR